MLLWGTVYEASEVAGLPIEARGRKDSVVIALDADGTPVRAVSVGVEGNDLPVAAAPDGKGGAVVVLGGDHVDSFGQRQGPSHIVRVDASGAASTPVPLKNGLQPESVSVDDQGRVWVLAMTSGRWTEPPDDFRGSGELIVTNTASPIAGYGMIDGEVYEMNCGAPQAVVTALREDGTVAWSTPFGGSGDWGGTVAVGPDGRLVALAGAAVLWLE